MSPGRRTEKQSLCSRRLHRYATKLLPFVERFQTDLFGDYWEETWLRAAANYFARLRHAMEACDLCGRVPPDPHEWGLEGMMYRVNEDLSLLDRVVIAIRQVGCESYISPSYHKARVFKKALKNLPPEEKNTLHDLAELALSGDLKWWVLRGAQRFLSGQTAETLGPRLGDWSVFGRSDIVILAEAEER